jgi:hypothetical protein
VAASGPADRQHPTDGVILGISRAHLLASVGRLAEAAELYHALGPVDAWWPSPHALLHSYAFGIGVAVAVDDATGLDRLYQLLAPYRCPGRPHRGCHRPPDRKRHADRPGAALVQGARRDHAWGDRRARADEAEYKALLSRSGLSLVRTIPTATPFPIIEARVRRS